MTPKLLVSVRNASEAQAALHGGADIIDIKDPAAGSLGRASTATISSIVELVAGRLPVTAALGELAEGNTTHVPPGLTFTKLGLANAPHDWRHRLTTRARFLSADPGSRNPEPVPLIPVAYADHARAAAPSPDTVLTWAITHPAQGPPGILIDTAIKDGRGLLHWLSETTIRDLTTRARRDNLFIAVAGSLRADDLPRLIALNPDIIAVRGAACDGNDRTATISADRVRTLKSLLTAHAHPAATTAS